MCLAIRPKERYAIETELFQHAVGRPDHRWRWHPAFIFVTAVGSSRGSDIPVAPGADSQLREMIEAEWHEHPAASQPTPPADAAGGCDEIKDETRGFHTAETKDPWWQVDLGAGRSIDRIVVWNRCEGVEARADDRVPDHRVQGAGQFFLGCCFHSVLGLFAWSRSSFLRGLQFAVNLTRALMTG